MREAILNFNQQFSYEPEIINPGDLVQKKKFIIAGMGGSNLVADLIKIRDPFLDIITHRNYGLPALSSEELNNRLFIADSYSGATEETIDALDSALKQKLPAAVIAVGGELIEMAKKYGLPYIQLPDTGIQPRSALGFQIRAALKMMGRDDLLEETAALASALNPADYENEGRAGAAKLKNRIPIIYTSHKNIGIAYNWKIKLNESGKIPAYYNILPELNHNEMNGFDVADSNRELSKNFYFIFLTDPEDHPRIAKRFEILEQLYIDRGLAVETLKLSGRDAWSKIFSSLVIADWTALYTAEGYGLDAEQVPMVEEFKQLLKQ